jgi:hypothetical protein
MSYLQVREYCGLPKVSSYSQLNNTIGKEEEKAAVSWRFSRDFYNLISL